MFKSNLASLSAFAVLLIGVPAIQAADPADGNQVPDHEVIVVRDPEGRPLVEKHVALDQDDNFVNHGSHRVFNLKGEAIGGGKYEWGRKVGKWRRIYSRIDESPVVQQNAARGFRPPFVSDANFVDGQLDGVWVIADADGKTVIQWEFANGQREGQWTWFGPSGEVRKQVNYHDGQISADIVAFSGKDDVRVVARYIHGRRLVPDTEKYTNGKPKRQGHVLLPLVVTQVKTDWWRGVLEEEVVSNEGEQVRHGEYKFWHANGRPSVVGSYNIGKEVGPFTWYFDNGKKQTQGYFENGVREGQWNQWYANGTRKGTGVYQAGLREGIWRAWHENGMRRQETAYQSGKQIGATREWDRNGVRTESKVADRDRLSLK